MRRLTLLTSLVALMFSTSTLLAANPFPNQGKINLVVISGGSQTVAEGSPTTDFAPIVIQATDANTGQPAPGIFLRITIAAPHSMTCWIAANADPTVPVVLKTSNDNASLGRATLNAIAPNVGARCSEGGGTAFVVASALGVQAQAELTSANGPSPIPPSIYTITATGAGQTFSPALQGVTFTLTDQAGKPAANVPVGLAFLATDTVGPCFLSNGQLGPPSPAIVLNTNADGAVQIGGTGALAACWSMKSGTVNVGLCVGSQWSGVAENYVAIAGRPRALLERSARPATITSAGAICAQPPSMNQPSRLDESALANVNQALQPVSTPGPEGLSGTPPTAHFAPLVVKAVSLATIPPSPVPGTETLFTIAAPPHFTCGISRDQKPFEPTVLDTGADGTVALNLALGQGSANCHGPTGASGVALITASTDQTQIGIPLWIYGETVILSSNDHQSVSSNRGYWRFAPITARVTDIQGNPLSGQTLYLNVLPPPGQLCSLGAGDYGPPSWAVSDANGNATFNYTGDDPNAFICDDPKSPPTPQRVTALLSVDGDPNAHFIFTETEQ